MTKNQIAEVKRKYEKIMAKEWKDRLSYIEANDYMNEMKDFIDELYKKVNDQYAYCKVVNDILFGE